MAKLVDDPLSLLLVTGVEGGDDEHVLALDGWRQCVTGRKRPVQGASGDLVAGTKGEVAPLRHQLGAGRRVMEDRGQGDVRSDLMGPEGEVDHDTEVPAATPDRPEQVRVVLLAGGDEFARRQHDLRRQKIVTGQTPLAVEPADAPAEGQTGDAGGRDHAARDSQAEDLRLPVDLSPGRAPLNAYCLVGRVDPDAVHVAEVEHQPPVDGAVTGDVMPTGSDGEQHPVLPSQVHTVDDVGFARAPDDETWPTIDREILDDPNVVVRRITRSDDRPAEQRA